MTTSPLCQRIDLATPDGRARLDALRRTLVSQGEMVSPAGRQRTIDVFGEPLTPRQVVEKICRDVREQGIDAVLDYTRRIDGASLTRETLLVPHAALEAAHRQVEPGFLEAVRRIRDRVERFQKAILAKDVTVPLAGGGRLRQRYVPLDRVGVCVPGGAAAYPSTLLMAYGIEGLPRVDMIVGPGNLFVALAKEHVFGDVAIDSIAGPSEIVIVADDRANAEFIASDMLAQAEHSPGSAILLTSSAALADRVAAAVEIRVAELERGDLTRQSLERFGAIVVTQSDEESTRLADELAAEHLSIDTCDPETTLAKIRHAGAAFLGPFSPVAAGDYAAGPSHVLPTGGTARFAAGLNANHFLRGGSVIELAKADLEELADDIRTLADTEGLTAHRRSVEARIPPPSNA